MLPSNASPTISALILITGLPEFPPTISFVLTKLAALKDQNLPEVLPNNQED